MTLTEITEIYLRNIKRLHDEISLYSDDSGLWKLRGSVSNSGGNLCLHLLGNLNHFIGATFGNTGFVRNRDAEFNTKDLTKSQLLQMIMDAKETVSKSLASISENDLQTEFPFDFAGKHSNEYYLVFFIAHFEYHLGQVNYHRRMI